MGLKGRTKNLQKIWRTSTTKRTFKYLWFMISSSVNKAHPYMQNALSAIKHLYLLTFKYGTLDTLTYVETGCILKYIMYCILLHLNMTLHTCTIWITTFITMFISAVYQSTNSPLHVDMLLKLLKTILLDPIENVEWFW